MSYEMSQMNEQKSKVVALQVTMLFVCGFFVHNALADGKPLPTVLESGNNDIIRLQKGDIPSQELVIAPLSPSNLTSPNITTTAKDSSLAERDAPLVGSMQSRVRKNLNGVMKQKSDNQVGLVDTFNNLKGAVSGPAINEHSLSPQISPEPVIKLDEAVEARLVTICLQNAADTDRTKAFDIQRENTPRYIAGPGEQTCAKFEPTRQTVYFWKSDDAGKLALTLSNRLDLSNSDGTQVTLNWVKD